MTPQADIRKALNRIPWLLDLDPASLDRLAAIAELVETCPGQVLFTEGDREDSLYILLEGQVVLDMEIPTRGQPPFYTAEALDIIGWSSLTPIVRQRTASARVTQRGTLLVFQSALLQQLCDEDHDLGYTLMKRLSNVVATRLLTTRVYLMEMIAHSAPQEAG